MVRRADDVHYKICPPPQQEAVRFHFITEGIPEETRAALEGIAARRENTELRLYSPAGMFSEEERKIIAASLSFNLRAWTKAPYYQFLAAELLPPNVHKALYLDSDVLCTGSLEELFSLDLANHPCAMCVDPGTLSVVFHNRLGYSLEDGYYNSGVDLYNLDIWRKEDLKSAMLGWLAANPAKCHFPVQDDLSACLRGRVLPLDFAYNVYPDALYVYYWINEEKNNCLAANKQYLPREDWPALLAACEAPRLVHIWSAPKPWHRECANPFAAVWRYFYAASPWAAEPLLRLYPPAARAKIGLKRMGRKALEAARLVAPLPKPVPFPEEAYASARRVLGELQSGIQ